MVFLLGVDGFFSLDGVCCSGFVVIIINVGIK